MTLVERSAVKWGTTAIPFTVRRSPKRSTVSIAVEPSGAVVVTAPAKASMSALDGVVRKKAQWIVERTRRRSSMAPAPEREFVSGETVLYLGRQYRLKVVVGREVSPARLERGNFVVGVAAGGDSAERSAAVRSSMVAWYTQRAKERLPERAALLAAGLKLPPPSVLVRDQRLRWGSCDSRGTIRLNWRVIQAPSHLVDYVLVHELVHLLHRDHSRAFWREVGRAIPAFQQRRALLLEWGPKLVW